MTKNMLIDSAHAEETRVAIIDGEKLDRFDFEVPSHVQLKGNIYLAKIIRVEPSLQAAFVDYGGERHGFLGFSEIHYDYFQIPVGDRNELEERIQNAMAAHADDSSEDEEEIDPREISRLRYQFYRRYKIQEVIKKRQIMLVQVTKEERGNKGAALTTYISLAGRYCVLMPNMSRGSGVSRKVSNHADREKLKSIVSELHIKNGSTVIRTAGIGHSKAEIKKDFEYLKKLWDEIRETTLKSTAPCLIHEETGIIKRAIRDLYSRDIDSIIVEGESAYKTAKTFVKKLMPTHAKKVILYNDRKIPLFSKYKINDQINQIYSTRVDLPSGGYLVINTTEALVSIDVNSGKSTRERNIVGTALKTNMEAAVEIARQCRLRDLGGLIVVDFIDMEEKRYNSQVERCLREALREDKAKIQAGNIGNFGLLEFSRQRLRSSIVDANMITCPYCKGNGAVWSNEAIALQMLRRIEEACFSIDSGEVSVVVPQEVILYLLNKKKEFIAGLEARGLKLSFSIDNTMSPFDFKISSTQKLLIADEENSDDVQNQSIEVKQHPRKARNINHLSEQNSETVAEVEAAVITVAAAATESTNADTAIELETITAAHVDSTDSAKPTTKSRPQRRYNRRSRNRNGQSSPEAPSATIVPQAPASQKETELLSNIVPEQFFPKNSSAVEFVKAMYGEILLNKDGAEKISDNSNGRAKKSGWWQKLVKKPINTDEGPL
ncbi:MAG: ribonuclease E/G [Holosporaceae bacterium]|jgi:ribonuclease E|nr:ribonuclease E/G [Holosporaceae bacterium]